MASKKIISTITLIMCITSWAFGNAQVGETAPAFALNDPMGISVSLSDFKGKYVVLEWINYDCPFVKKHYNSGNMQKLQKKYTNDGIIWLAINSSAKGKQGNFSTKEILERSQDHEAAFSFYLLDESGDVGRAYGAKTTPHMFIINPDGKLIYSGGIDDIRSTDVSDIDKATNYVAAALDAALSGKAIAKTNTKPYGCSVKYAKK
jgi:peroxiredoxin